MTITEISLLIIALAFVVLVIFLCMVCFAGFKTLFSLRDILANMEHKMRCLDPFFHSLSNLGEQLEGRTEQYRKVILKRHFRKKNFEEEMNLDAMKDAIDLFAKGIILWKKIKRR